MVDLWNKKREERYTSWVKTHFSRDLERDKKGDLDKREETEKKRRGEYTGEVRDNMTSQAHKVGCPRHGGGREGDWN